MNCPMCRSKSARFCIRDGVDYFDCTACDFIFAHPDFLALTDRGTAPRAYSDDYWQMETSAARERSFGASLARFAEAALYCTIPVKRFLDIGTGPGFLLEALQYYLPSS